ncbi:Rv1733c family protein [Streptomyces sp. H27-D2]|uniref:Rv1733c family protein n=1 Tax=Streptomyces sp. H27-D2 TaxID=3046304 RepID=UPI002DBD9AD5|nr:hypothetical protein [Streptomyces sp. H27-D2]MEC4020774.1 hypothetical protein [Streptomyces sp. H27-D2]
MRAIVGLWRWRRNPLRRSTDRIETWAAFLAALLIVLGAPAVGWAAGGSAHGALLRTVGEQQHDRALVRVTVVRKVAHPPVDPDPETSSARDAHRRVFATWTAPDGSRHAGRISAPRAISPGQGFRIWTDNSGRITNRPMDGSTAASHAALAGVAAAAAAAGLVEGARRLVVWQLMQRRYARWDQEWDRAGQDWGRAGAGS